MIIKTQDLKPSNILITPNFQVKIADFGSAIEKTDRDGKGNFSLEGFSKWYKAPEQLFGS